VGLFGSLSAFSRLLRCFDSRQWFTSEQGKHRKEGQTMAPVIDVSRETLLERRRKIFESLGVDAQTFQSVEETRTLSGEEWEAKEELDAIAFLLGEDN
jgi:hypothetical protein